jgi:hypothetical protein
VQPQVHPHRLTKNKQPIVDYDLNEKFFHGNVDGIDEKEAKLTTILVQRLTFGIRRQTLETHLPLNQGHFRCSPSRIETRNIQPEWKVR